MMKHVITGSVFTLLFLFSCDRINDLTTFTYRQTTSFSIPSSSGLNLPVNLATPDMSASSSNTFSNNNTRVDLIKDVTLNSLELSITNPSDQTFRFIRSIYIYIDAEGEDEQLIAQIEDIPENVGSTLTLETTGANLNAYIKAESYNLKNQVVIREVVNRNVDILAEMEFSVTADVL